MARCSERAERLRDFFSLQMSFAELMAARQSIPLRAAILQFTSFHRRFGLGDPNRAVSLCWEAYVSQLEMCQDTAERVRWTQEFFTNTPHEHQPIDQHVFGCFSCDCPDDKGILGIHFKNRDQDGLGPLDSEKVARRKRDLAEMFGFIKAQYPTASRIAGRSWLYNLRSYRRLFPADYGGSATPVRRTRLTGMSSWGQFLSHTEAVKSTMRETFLRNLENIDLAAPWRSLPLPVLAASAPVISFYQFYSA